MKDYSAMSDFEVNLLVAKSALNFDQLSSTQCLNKAHVQWADGVNWHKFDPCNNPSDAWPIITGNRISLVAPMSYDSTQDWMAYPAHDSDIDPTDTNPLRAAMICYLMMKDEAVKTQGEKS
jgi:hypothetical protein